MGDKSVGTVMYTLSVWLSINGQQTAGWLAHQQQARTQDEASYCADMVQHWQAQLQRWQGLRHKLRQLPRGAVPRAVVQASAQQGVRHA